MNDPDLHEGQRYHGDVLTAISDGMVALLKEFYGRGPTRTPTQRRRPGVVIVAQRGMHRSPRAA